MFSAERSLFMHALPRGARFFRATLLTAALSAGAGSCALQVHEGDGLASDGREVQINPALSDAGRPGVPKGMIESCKQLELFKQVVMPVFTTEFQGIPQGIPDEVLTPQSCVSCHDTKNKAVSVLFMDRTLPDITCLAAYARQLTDGDIVASSDPGMLERRHEFKFQRIEDYNRFREAVETWVAAEGIVTMPKP